MSASSGSDRVGPTKKVKNENAPVDENGFLDLSNKELNTLNGRCFSAYKKVKDLRLNENFFETVSLLKFEILQKADLSRNLFTHFNGSMVNSRSLTVLDLSHNDIVEVSINTIVSLVEVNLSNNAIQDIEPIRLPHLKTVNLSGNLLKSLPNVSRCPVLEVLDLSNNEITTLKESNEHLPKCIEQLDVCCNLIEDLTEVYHLISFKSLFNVNFINNAAMSSLRSLDYRSFILFVIPSLQYVDGDVLGQLEQIVAERMMMSSKMNRHKQSLQFGPEAHEVLLELLNSQKVVLDETGAFPADPMLADMLRKKTQFSSTENISGGRESIVLTPTSSSRRMTAPANFVPERADDSFDDAPSIHSPFENYMKKLEKNKENEFPPSVSTPKSANRAAARSLQFTSPLPPQRSIDRSRRILERPDKTSSPRESVASRFSGMSGRSSMLMRSDSMESNHSSHTVVLSSRPLTDRSTPIFGPSSPQLQVEPRASSSPKTPSPQHSTQEVMEAPSPARSSPISRASSRVSVLSEVFSTSSPPSPKPLPRHRQVQQVTPTAATSTSTAVADPLFIYPILQQMRSLSFANPSECNTGFMDASVLTTPRTVEGDVTVKEDSPRPSLAVIPERLEEVTETREEPRRFAVQDVTFQEPNVLEQLTKLYDNIYHRQEQQNVASDEISKTLEAMFDRITSIEQELSDTKRRLSESERRNELLVPCPSRITATKGQNGNLDLAWQVPAVAGFNIYIDDELAGKTLAPAARIQDIDDGRQHVIKIQAIGLNGQLGEMSKEFVIGTQK